MSTFSKLLTRTVRREWAWLWRPRPWTARPTPSSSGSWPRSSGSGSLTSAWTVEPGPGTSSVFFSVWRIRDILVRFRIRIWGSVSLTNGSVFGSGSCSFHQWLSRRIIFLLHFIFLLLFEAGFRIRIDLMRIRIQHFIKLRIRIPDPDPGFYDQKLIKKLLLKKKLNFFGSKTTIYLSLGLHKGRPSHRKSLQPSKENIQYLKTWKFWTFFYFCGSFLPSWIRIRIRNMNADPDSATQINADPDPPKPCFEATFTSIFQR